MEGVVGEREREKKRDWKKEVGKEKEMTEIEIPNN